MSSWLLITDRQIRFNFLNEVLFGAEEPIIPDDATKTDHS